MCDSESCNHLKKMGLFPNTINNNNNNNISIIIIIIIITLIINIIKLWHLLCNHFAEI